MMQTVLDKNQECKMGSAENFLIKVKKIRAHTLDKSQEPKYIN